MFEADPVLSEIKELLDKLDINSMSPVEALLKLNELKSKLK
jgi:DNA mismatch repair protein MutS